MKFLRILSVLAIALCIAGSVYAETQSVKVSGDLTMRGIFRDRWDYQSKPAETSGSLGDIAMRESTWAMTVAEVEVDADLTDNVQTVIRLVNQRDWNVAHRNISNSVITAVPNGRGGYTASPDEFDVMVDLAYVTLKDFIYSPLTVTIGRQDLWFGKGFIVGANLQNPGTGVTVQDSLLVGAGNLSAPEYTAVTSFDAIKGVLDYDPWTITGVYANIYEDAIQANDGVSLWGVNVGYKFDIYKAESEAYWFYKHDRSSGALGAIKGTNDVHTLGLRGSFDPIDVLTLAGEGAYQTGEYVGHRLQIASRDRSAWAVDFSGEWRYLMEKYSWKPKLGAEYVFYSGARCEENRATAAGEYRGWDGMYRGKFDSAIREWTGKFYATARYPARTDGTIQSTADASFTNQHQVVFMGSIEPIESLILKANYNLFWNQKPYLYSEEGKSQGMVGQEVDLTAKWAYTEDVSFDILAAWFIPDEVYYGDMDEIATDVVGSVKVNF